MLPYILSFLILILFSAPCPAKEWNFEDDWGCRLFGCVLVHDSRNAEIFLTDGPSGTPATVYDSRGTGIRTVKTGSTETAGCPEKAESSSAFGIDINGDGVPDISADSDSDGFTDSRDRMAFFVLTQNSDVILTGRDVRHSFYAASDTPFSLRTYVSRFEARGELGRAMPPGAVFCNIDVQASGSDEGFSFGSRSSDSGFRAMPGTGNIAALLSGPVGRAVFENPTCPPGSGEVIPGSVRINTRYLAPEYDLSLGTGGLRMEIVYEICNP